MLLDVLEEALQQERHLCPKKPTLCSLHARKLKEATQVYMHSIYIMNALLRKPSSYRTATLSLMPLDPAFFISGSPEAPPIPPCPPGHEQHVREHPIRHHAEPQGHQIEPGICV